MLEDEEEEVGGRQEDQHITSLFLSSPVCRKKEKEEEQVEGTKGRRRQDVVGKVKKGRRLDAGEEKTTERPHA